MAYLGRFPQEIQVYVLQNENDWINDLPEIAQQVELDRLQRLDNGTWWRGYREKIATGEYSPSKNPFR